MGCMCVLVAFLLVVIISTVFFAGLSWLVVGVVLPIFWAGCPVLTFWQHVAVGVVLGILFGGFKGYGRKWR